MAGPVPPQVVSHSWNQVTQDVAVSAAPAAAGDKPGSATGGADFVDADVGGHVGAIEHAEVGFGGA